MRLKRRIAFRIAAVCLGLGVVLLAEVLCHAFGWGLPENTDDPFVGFESVVPLFVPGEDGSTMKIAEGRLRFFAPDSFPARKPGNTFRIFCLGGSTVQGRPFSIETSFTTWLTQSLSAADPTRNWEVVNCGGVSYASYRLVPILQECLAYEPDLFIVCTGHNEFLEDRTYAAVKSPASVQRLLGHSRLFTLMRAAVQPDRNQRAKFLLEQDVQARLDYRGGLDLYKRDDDWRRGVIRHFKTNLTRMTQACESADVPLLFLLPPSNLADSPPFKSQPDPQVANQTRELVSTAAEYYRTDLPAAIEKLRQACDLDPRCAVHLYELGRACEAAGRIDEARRYLIQARDEDICPLRMISSLEQSMTAVADDADVPLLNLHAFLESRSKQPILGDGMLVDHIHPSFRGHQLIADQLVRELTRQGSLAPTSGWEDRAAAAHAAHFDSLDSLYFLKGQRTLESLREWARGRGRNLPELPR